MKSLGKKNPALIVYQPLLWMKTSFIPLGTPPPTKKTKKPLRVKIEGRRWTKLNSNLSVSSRLVEWFEIFHRKSRCLCYSYQTSISCTKHNVRSSHKYWSFSLVDSTSKYHICSYFWIHYIRLCNEKIVFSKIYNLLSFRCVTLTFLGGYRVSPL